VSGNRGSVPITDKRFDSSSTASRGALGPKPAAIQCMPGALSGGGGGGGKGAGRQPPRIIVSGGGHE